MARKELDTAHDLDLLGEREEASKWRENADGEQHPCSLPRESDNDWRV